MSNYWLNLLKDLRLLSILETLAGNSKAGYSTGTRSDDVQGSTGKKESSSFAEIIKKASLAYGVEEKIIRAVIQHESGFNPRAVSRAGAQGLMQLMPATARSLGVKDPFDPEENIMAGTRYLKQKLDEFGGNLHLALAAYNAGSGAVRKYGGIPPYEETRKYVDRVIKTIDHMA